jgi:hypothetical protein
MNNDALNNIKKLRDVLNEAIAALEAGREVQVEEKRPCDVATWHEVAVFRDRDYRCVIELVRRAWNFATAAERKRMMEIDERKETA